MLLPGFSPEAQRKLLGAHAVIVGCGALGCAIADTFARAGVGTLTLIDRDVVELTNLQRQTLFTEADAREGLPKAEAARRRLAAINSDLTVHTHVADFNAANADRLLFSHSVSPPLISPSLLLDGTDNFETRYLLNDLAVKHGLPYIYAGAVGTHALQAAILPGRTACLRCLFPDPPAPGSQPTCDTAGVLGPIIHVAAAHQCTDALKLLIGRDDLLPHTLLEIDLWANTQRSLDLGPPRPDCPCCAQRRFDFLNSPRADLATLCGQDAIQVLPPTEATLDLAAMHARLIPHGDFRAVGGLLLRGALAREPGDTPGSPLIGLTLFADARAVFKGTTNPTRARSLYARYIGA